MRAPKQEDKIIIYCFLLIHWNYSLYWIWEILVHHGLGCCTAAETFVQHVLATHFYVPWVMTVTSCSICAKWNHFLNEPPNNQTRAHGVGSAELGWACKQSAATHWCHLCQECLHKCGEIALLILTYCWYMFSFHLFTSNPCYQK